ncbi:MAG: HEAT repeat domain-containing protein [Planctomycetes bacterium]|nr:HEAT repeat domain-containing protein [Planctomycetota bacterium]
MTGYRARSKRAAVLAGALLALALSGVTASSQEPGARVPPRPPQRDPRGVRAEATALTGWQTWWALNKDRYLVPGTRGGVAAESESAAVFFGRKKTVAPRPPFAEERRGHALVEQLCAALRDEQEQVRASAAYAIGLLGKSTADGCTQHLLKALTDGSVRVQEAAIVALGLTGKPMAFAPLAAIVEGSAGGAKQLGRDSVAMRRRGLAVLALGFLGDARAAEPLGRLAAQEQHSLELRLPAVTALGLLGDARAAPTLIALASDRRAPVRLVAAAVGALGRLGALAGMEIVAQALEDRRADVRRAAVLALGILVPQLGGEPLEQTGDGSVPAGRSGPDAVVVQQFQDRVRRVVAELAREDVFRVRIAAVVTLGQIGGPEDRELLASLVQDGNVEVAAHAALGLGILGRRGHDADGSGWARLHEAFRAARSHDRAGALAIALGLYGNAEAAAAIGEQLQTIRSRQLGAQLSVALGLLRSAPSAGEIARVMLATRDEAELHDTVVGFALVAPEIQAVASLRQVVAQGKDRLQQAIAATGLAFVGVAEDLETAAALVGRSEIPSLYRALLIEGVGQAGNVRPVNPIAHLTVGFDLRHATEAERFVIELKW